MHDGNEQRPWHHFIATLPSTTKRSQELVAMTTPGHSEKMLVASGVHLL